MRAKSISQIGYQQELLAPDESNNPGGETKQDKNRSLLPYLAEERADKSQANSHGKKRQQDVQFGHALIPQLVMNMASIGFENI